MTIPFIDGPYNGLKLGVIEIERHLVILTLAGHRGARRFAYLPAIEDWPEVVAGRMRVDDSEVFHYYEMVSTSRGLQFQSDRDGRGYHQAIMDEFQLSDDSRGNGGRPAARVIGLRPALPAAVLRTSFAPWPGSARLGGT